MQQITTASEKLTKKNIITRISDVPGGVSLVMSTLVAGSVVPQGTPLSAPASGKRTVCKQAVILAGSSTTVFRVDTVTNPFKVGEFIGRIVGGKAYPITAIAVGAGAGYDTVTIGTALENATVGEFLYEMAAEAADVDSTLNVAIGPGTSTGITEDLTSAALKATAPNQSTIAVVVGTTTEPGDAAVTVSSDLFADVVLAVAIADNDTAAIAASKIRLALQANATIAANFNVEGTLENVVLVHKASTTSGAVLKNAADVILKEAFQVPSTTQFIFIADAQVRADVLEGAIGAEYLATLPGVIVVKY